MSERPDDTSLTPLHLRLEQLMAERRFWAHDLHDGPLQYLVAAKMLLDSAIESHEARAAASLSEARSDDDAQLEQRWLVQAAESLQHGIADLRRMLSVDRKLVEGELAEACRADVQRRGDQRVEFECSAAADCGDIETEVSIAAFRVFQELVANAVRHSQAEKIHVSLQITAQAVQLRVVDNGRGFDLNAAVVADEPIEGTGLRGIRQRVSAIGGEVHIQSEPAVGTTVEVTIPRVESGRLR